MGVPCSSVPDRDVAAASHFSSGGSRAASRLARSRLREPVRRRGRDRRPTRVAVTSSSLRRRGETKEDGVRDREKETGRHRCRRRRREDQQWLACGGASMGRAKARRGKEEQGASGHEGIWEGRRRRHGKVGGHGVRSEREERKEIGRARD
jgi:hypothetical protein